MERDLKAKALLQDGRWLRPAFQQTTQAVQVGLGIEMEESATPASKRRAWPASLPERVSAIRNLLTEEQQPLDAAALARIFIRARKQDVKDIAETLVSLNQVRRVGDRYTV